MDYEQNRENDERNRKENKEKGYVLVRRRTQENRVHEPQKVYGTIQAEKILKPFWR